MLLVAFILVVSCKEESKSEKIKTSTETTTGKKPSVATEKEVEMTSDKEQLLATTIAYFKDCKENSTSRNDCRNSITKMI